jgi:hypothetical protein
LDIWLKSAIIIVTMVIVGHFKLLKQKKRQQSTLMKLARLTILIHCIEQHRQFDGWLLAEAAVAITIVTPLCYDCDFVV